MNCLKNIKLNSFPGGNVVDFCVAILVDADCLEINGAFKYYHIGYITLIFKRLFMIIDFIFGQFRSKRRL